MCYNQSSNLSSHSPHSCTLYLPSLALIHLIFLGWQFLSPPSCPWHSEPRAWPTLKIQQKRPISTNAYNYTAKWQCMHNKARKWYQDTSRQVHHVGDCITAHSWQYVAALILTWLPNPGNIKLYTVWLCKNQPCLGTRRREIRPFVCCLPEPVWLISAQGVCAASTGGDLHALQTLPTHTLFTRSVISFHPPEF